MSTLLEACAQRTTRWRFFHWYWGDAIAIDGLLAAGERGVRPAKEYAAETITRWHEQCPATFDDVLAPGRAIVDLAASGDIPPEAAHRFFASVTRLPTLPENIPLLEPHRPAFRFGVCIDAVYHLPSALAAYGRWQSRRELIRDAITLANSMMDMLTCDAGWAQWYDGALDRNNSAVWTRGLGWAVLGLLDLLTVSDHAPGTDRCHDTAASIMQLLSNTIGDDGTWPSILHDADAKHETSTSAFFVAAAQHPALDQAARPDSPVVDQAMGAMCRSLSSDAALQGVSADILPSFELAGYRRFTTEPSPWGQGAALRALASEPQAT